MNSTSLKIAVHPPAVTPLAQAIQDTILYGDIFQYPLTLAEIHRYLIGQPATLEQVTAALQEQLLPNQQLIEQSGFYMPPGREQNVEIRRGRAQHAQKLWGAALYYGRWIAQLPFVRLVAVTGSVAVLNADPHADIDFFIITANDRLWLCRALVIGVVRWAKLQGIDLCPNYFLAERALHVGDESLYTARELVQMVPLSGRMIYDQLRQANSWTNRYLPNAAGAPAQAFSLPEVATGRPAEKWLNQWGGARLEQWEQQRKIHKFTQKNPAAREVSFGADWCKGHFTAHQGRVLNAYQAKKKG